VAVGQSEFVGDKAYKVAAELLSTEQAYVDKLHLLDQVSCSTYFHVFCHISGQFLKYVFLVLLVVGPLKPIVCFILLGLQVSK